MRRQFPVHPLNSRLVGRHRQLTKYVLSGPCEIGSIKHDLIFIERILELLPPQLAFLLREIEPIQVVHAIVHGIFGRHLPERANILPVELVCEAVVRLILEEAIASAVVRRYHDVATCYHRVAWTHAAVLVLHLPTWRLDALPPVNLIWSERLDTLLLQKVLEVLELGIGRVRGVLMLWSLGPRDQA